MRTKREVLGATCPKRPCDICGFNYLACEESVTAKMVWEAYIMGGEDNEEGMYEAQTA